MISSQVGPLDEEHLSINCHTPHGKGWIFRIFLFPLVLGPLLQWDTFSGKISRFTGIFSSQLSGCQSLILVFFFCFCRWDIMAVLPPTLWFAAARWLQVSGELLQIWLGGMLLGAMSSNQVT